MPSSLDPERRHFFCHASEIFQAAISLGPQDPAPVVADTIPVARPPLQTGSV